MSSSPARRYWENSSARLAGCINLAAWLDKFAPWAFAMGSVVAGGLYLARRTHGYHGWVLLAALLSLAMAALFAWRQARSGFFGQEEARVLIEHHLSMDAALSAASAGVAAWPAPARRTFSVVRWHAPVTWGWLAAACALILAGWSLPIPAADVVVVRPLEKPPALAQAEAWLQQLSQLAVADPASVAALQARARELSEQSPENQYSHSSLEAADALRDQTAAGMKKLADGMDAASAVLSPLGKGTESLTDAQLKNLSGQLDAALNGLSEGTLAPRGDLLKQLAAEKLAGLHGLSPEQAAKLGKQLADAAHRTRGVSGAFGGKVKIGAGEAMMLVRATGTGTGVGTGGPGGGIESAPLAFMETASDAGEGTTQTITNNDYSHAALGDLLGTQKGEHKVDPTQAIAVSAAGAVASPADGGAAVWVNRLTPDERTALKDFFK